MTPLIIVGIGGFGREVIDVVEAVNAAGPTQYELLGLLDDYPSDTNLALLEERGLPYLGTVDEWLAGGCMAEFVVGIANPIHREAIDRRLVDGGSSAATLVHPASSLGSRVTLAPGTIVCAGARLTTNIHLGAHAHVHVNATIGHDSVLGDFASVYPLSAVSGNCVLGVGATVGANATVLQGLSLGARAFVGAGAVATKDVPPRTVVKGIPAR